jgi:transcription initiation factor TFIIIB Brf1 subunit/transcription initiation factor TFIIB
MEYSEELLKKINDDLDSLITKKEYIYKNESTNHFNNTNTNTNTNDTKKECLCGLTTSSINKEDLFYSSDGYLLCYNCGFVFEQQNIVDEAEWVNYENDANGQSKIRCNTVQKDMMGNYLFSTSIRKNKNCDMNLFTKLNKLQQYLYSNQNSVIKKQLNVKELFNTELLNTLDENIISEIIEQYIKLNKTYRGEKRLAIIAALTYFILKTHKLNKTPQELSYLFNIETNLITTSMIELIDMGKIENSEALPLELLDNFISRLNINKSFYGIIKKITLSILELNMINTSKPQTIISSTILYLCYRKKFTIIEKDLENISCISLHTLKHYTKIIIQNEQKLLNYLKKSQTHHSM